MIEAADEFVGEFSKTYRPIRDAWDSEFAPLVTELGLTPSKRHQVEFSDAELTARLASIEKRTREDLGTASNRVDSLEDGVARLVVVFRDERVAKSAGHLVGSLRQSVWAIRRVLEPPENAKSGALPTVVETRLEIALGLLKGAKTRREELLDAVGRAIRSRNP